MQFLKRICNFAENITQMTENITGEAHRPGRIEVVCGSMFSGKTEELIRRLRRAQFFDMGLVDVCNELAYRGVRVIIAGLDMDYKGVPFGPMPALCAIADDVTKVHAICVKCGNLAYVSHRTIQNDKRVLLGETQEYEPLCRDCYQKALENKKSSQ